MEKEEYIYLNYGDSTSPVGSVFWLPIRQFKFLGTIKF